MSSWNPITDQIAKLRERARHWQAEAPGEADFMPAFAGVADEIVEEAAKISEDALESVHMLIDEILIELGYMRAAERQT